MTSERPEPDPTDRCSGDWGCDDDAESPVTPEAQRELHDKADKLLRKERRNHTLSPTALVNEAFLRLARQRKRTWSSREGFLAAATLMMKRVLTNHGRDRNALKRGGKNARIEYLDAIHGEDRGGNSGDGVRECLKRLQERDPRAAEIAFLRLYRGLGNEVISETMGMSLRSVEREWAAARAWLRAELTEEHQG